MNLDQQIDPAKIKFLATSTDLEVYEAFYDETLFVRLKLRSGHFVATSLAGEVIYRSKAGGWNRFWAEERATHLDGAREALVQWLRSQAIE